MKPEISRIIYRGTSRNGWKIRSSEAWNNIRRLSIVERGGGVRKAIVAKRIAEIVVQVASNNRRVFHGEETSERERERRVRTRLDSPTVVPFPTSPLSASKRYIHVYIYIFRRAKKFLLSTIVTCHRIRIACLLLVFKTVVVSRTWNDFTRELTYKAFIYWYFARIFARIKKENSIF